MSIDTLSARLQTIANKAIAHCKVQYGKNGFKLDEGIDSSIGWRPTFYLKPAKFRIVAFEVEDNLFPEVLKGAALEIIHYDFPISVYQVCSLEAYQTDPKHAKVNLLRKHGFGLITVDEDDHVTVQTTCIPLMQHISPDQFEKEISELNQVLKVSFRAAYETYRTNEGQGLQQAGQIVEGLILSIADQSIKKKIFTRGLLTDPLADIIDELYRHFKSHRAALGDARAFVKEFRNTASHAPKTAKQAADKIRKCKTGFLDAISVCRKLRETTRALGYQARIYTT